MTTETLKPCPFCGSSAVLTTGGFGEKQVRCAFKGCGAGLSPSAWQATDEQAARAWNRRVEISNEF
jgi:Lar family restriction alleviation protein